MNRPYAFRIFDSSGAIGTPPVYPVTVINDSLTGSTTNMTECTNLGIQSIGDCSYWTEALVTLISSQKIDISEAQSLTEVGNTITSPLHMILDTIRLAHDNLFRTATEDYIIGNLSAPGSIDCNPQFCPNYGSIHDLEYKIEG